MGSDWLIACYAESAPVIKGQAEGREPHTCWRGELKTILTTLFADVSKPSATPVGASPSSLLQTRTFPANSGRVSYTPSIPVNGLIDPFHWVFFYFYLFIYAHLAISIHSPPTKSSNSLFSSTPINNVALVSISACEIESAHPSMDPFRALPQHT